MNKLQRAKIELIEAELEATDAKRLDVAMQLGVLHAEREELNRQRLCLVDALIFLLKDDATGPDHQERI
jgi:hypothetical protein